MEAGTRIQAEDHAEVLSHLSSDDSKIDWTTFLVGLISVGQHALLAYIAPKMKHKLTADGGLALFQACVRGNKLAFETLCNAEANITQDLHVMIGLMLHATPMQAVDWKILLTNLVIAKQAGCIEFLAKAQKVEVARHGAIALAAAMNASVDGSENAICKILEAAGVDKNAAISLQKAKPQFIACSQS